MTLSMPLCDIVERCRRSSAGFVIFLLFAFFPDLALSQQTLVVDGSDKRGWVFKARPDINQSGEAPIRGIEDHAGGNASLNFSTTQGSDSSRGARLARSDFPTSMSTIFTLNDLTSMSWYVHHSSSGAYPKIAIWVEWMEGNTLQREAIYFRPQNMAVTPGQWDRVEVNWNSSNFTTNGAKLVPSNAPNKTTRTFAEWQNTIGTYAISKIQVQYNSPGNEYASYVDYVEINGTTFDFEAAVPQPPNAPQGLRATPGDGAVSLSFTPGKDHGNPISDYEYRLGGGDWQSAGKSTSPIVLTGLTNGTRYTASLRAVSAAGNGESASVDFTPKAPVKLTANAQADFYKWTFKAVPDVSAPGEASITGIADALGGSASLNFTLAGQMGNKRVVKLRQQDFPPVLQDLRYLRDLTSVSWRINHSDPLTYPRFSVTLRAKPNINIGSNGETKLIPYKKYERLAFLRKNQKLTPGEWDTVTVDFTDGGSQFRHNGPLDAFSPINPGTHQKRPIAQWIDGYGDLEIAAITWAYGSKDNALTFTSYIDYLEINGVTFDFEGAPLQPPGPPTDVVATARDGQVSIAFTAAADNGTPLTRYEYQLEALDSANNWTAGDWISTGGTNTTLTLTGLTNGTDYRVGLRAVSNAGVGEESAPVTFAPRKANQNGIDLVVEADTPRGFSLSGWTAEYVKNRNNVGVADGIGGLASIDASLTGQGGDRWGLFLKPAQYKEEVKAVEGGAYGGRKIDRLSDLTSLSFRTQHSDAVTYPRLGLRISRDIPARDGKTVAQLDVDMRDMPAISTGWNLVTIDFDATFFRSSFLAEGEESESKPLSEWIEQYGDRRIDLIRWQTGSGSGETINTTYVDQIEVNGVTFNFEGLPPLPPAAPINLVAAPGTEEAIIFSFTPGDPGDKPITHYEYSLNGEATWESLDAMDSAPYQFAVTSGLQNGREDWLSLRAVSAAGAGESATIAFRPRADLADVTVIVNEDDPHGWYLSIESSQYVKDRLQGGIPNYIRGNAYSLNASLANAGDIWRVEVKATDLNEGGRVLQKWHDIESLSYEVWHDKIGNYPALSIVVDRLDGQGTETLVLQVNQQPLGTAGAWNKVTIDPATSRFKHINANNSNEANAGATYTLNQWTALYGNRAVNRIRLGGPARVAQQSYVDFIEVNGAIYDFEIVPPPVVAPSPVQVAATAGDKQADITFSAGNNAGATVLAYEYRLGNGAWTSVGDTVAPFTVADLTNGTTYSLAMRTVSAGLGDKTLTSDASESVTFVPVGLPLPPTNLSATVGDGSVVANFFNSDPNNGAAITNYHVSLDGGAFAPLSPADTSGPLLVTGLTNGQAHTIALKTQTSVGLSAASDSLTFTPVSGASPPDAPINVVLTPGDKQVSVSFTPGSDNGAAITNYAYQVDGGSWRALNPASTSTSFTIAGLENGEAYTVSVRAINAEGSGANSSPVTATLPRPKVTIITDQSETIDLDITPENGSSCSVKTAALTPAPALESNVKSAYVNMLDFSLVNCNPGETVGIAITLSQDPPENGIPYKYQGGEWRAIEGATITGRTIRYNLTDNGPLDADPTAGKINDPLAVAVPSGKPDAPYDLSATAYDGSATISFTPGNDQGNEITNYLYSTNGVDYTALDPADASSPVTITGLANRESVSITLRAQNSEGDSPSSEPVVITPQAPATPVSIPIWPLSLLAGLVAWLGRRRLSVI